MHTKIQIPVILFVSWIFPYWVIISAMVFHFEFKATCITGNFTNYFWIRFENIPCFRVVYCDRSAITDRYRLLTFCVCSSLFIGAARSFDVSGAFRRAVSFTTILHLCPGAILDLQGSVRRYIPLLTRPLRFWEELLVGVVLMANWRSGSGGRLSDWSM